MQYAPLQLGDRERPGVRYAEFVPSRDLAPLVYRYWELSTAEVLESPFSYRILPDGCMDVIIDCDSADAWIARATAEVSSVDLGTRFNYFGVRFLPGAFPLLAGLDAGEASRRMIDLSDTGVPACFRPEAIAERAGVRERIRQAEHMLRALRGSMFEADARVQFALSALADGQGDIAVEQEMTWAVTPRHLRRLVHRAVGLTPKELARVVRFQSLLRNLRGQARESWLGAALHAGYCDQSHWIREMKRMYGLTPGRLAPLICA